MISAGKIPADFFLKKYFVQALNFVDLQSLLERYSTATSKT